MGWACNMNKYVRNAYKILVENFKKTGHLGDICLYERVIFKRVLDCKLNFRLTIRVQQRVLVSFLMNRPVL